VTRKTSQLLVFAVLIATRIVDPYFLLKPLNKMLKSEISTQKSCSVLREMFDKMCSVEQKTAISHLINCSTVIVFTSAKASVVQF